MNTVTLTTHICSRNDDLEAFMNSSGVLLAGEVVLAKVDSTIVDSTGSALPIFMMKAGDGNHTFNELPWVMCPASDVYPWAKAETLQYSSLPSELVEEIQGYEERLSKLEEKTTSVSGTTLIFN